jgi:hypothetical protein
MAFHQARFRASRCSELLPHRHAWIAQWKSFLVVRDVELQIFGQRLVSLRRVISSASCAIAIALSN